MQFYPDILMGQQREKNEIKIHYNIQEWNKFTTTYDILQNHSNYPTVCLLLDTEHRTDHCITVSVNGYLIRIWNSHYHSQVLG